MPVEVVYLALEEVQDTEQAVAVACEGSTSVMVFDVCDDVLNRRIVSAAAGFPEVTFSELVSPNWLLTASDVQGEFSKSTIPRQTSTDLVHIPRSRQPKTGWRAVSTRTREVLMISVGPPALPRRKHLWASCIFRAPHRGGADDGRRRRVQSCKRSKLPDCGSQR